MIIYSVYDGYNTLFYPTKKISMKQADKMANLSDQVIISRVDVVDLNRESLCDIINSQGGLYAMEETEIEAYY